MVATVHTGTLQGIEAVHVVVEADLVRRLPRVSVVGLAADAVRESTERVRSAILAAGLEFPKLRVTINLAPADLRKTGTGFDLPIALAILAVSGQVPQDKLDGVITVGELSLDGGLRPVPGALSLAMLGRELGYHTAIFPVGCAAEAAVLERPLALGAASLAAVVAHLRGEAALSAVTAPESACLREPPDFAEVRGQPMAKRALEVAAAGGHSLLMVGPPGVGKTMLASRLPGVLPALTQEEALEVTRVHSVAGLLPAGSGLVRQRPFRAPHHSVTSAGLIGNARLRPGELSLAHNGVLFLDELPEFSRSVLEQLRAPLESREVLLTRAAGSVRLPAAVSLIAAANPCPCGYFGHPTRPCVCTESQRTRYAAKLSGPLADRFDMLVLVQALESDELMQAAPSERSAKVRARVEAARARQVRRFSEMPCRWNADAAGPRLRALMRLEPDVRRVLAQATDTLGLSGRAYDKVLSVARTLGDLDGAEHIRVGHVMEAVAFRAQDRAQGAP
ncbi:MAG: YifB family Mg chelatase-like AAA ATPase [Alphaproteobacteria bacterium]|nr:YifB family Mg chelatase-like AAA ATPase [Alphaproteobacteria bacterium]